MASVFVAAPKHEDWKGRNENSKTRFEFDSEFFSRGCVLLAARAFIERTRQLGQLGLLLGQGALDLTQGGLAVVFHRLGLLTDLSELFFRRREFHRQSHDLGFLRRASWGCRVVNRTRRSWTSDAITTTLRAAVKNPIPKYMIECGPSPT